MDKIRIGPGKKNIVAGLGCMILFFLAAMVLAFLGEHDGNDLPPVVELILGFFLEEGYLPSLTKFEWHLKYAHLHGEGLGIFCALYGLFLGMATRPFVLKVTPWLVILGTFIVPLSFLVSMIYPSLIYGLTLGSLVLTFSFILFMYDILRPKE